MEDWMAERSSGSGRSKAERRERRRRVPVTGSRVVWW
jgi:hypothetical protein